MTVSKTTMAAIRFGYGFHPDHTPPGGPSDLLGELEAGAASELPFPVMARKRRRDMVAELTRLRRAKADASEIREARRDLRRATMREGAEQLLNRALSPNGFFERLVGFWADHFTVGAKNAAQATLLPEFEPFALRPNINGSFADLLVAVVQHPAMMSYLDQTESFGPNSRVGRRAGRGLNENLAREVLELHTLGVGADYTQTDVRNAANLLTGFGVDRATLSFKYFRQRAEPGTWQVLGRSYGGALSADRAIEMLHDLARHPATIRHVARKLVVHFIADEPPADAVSAVERAWRESDGNLPAIYRALVMHPAAWTDFGQKVKRPQDLMVSTLRAMGLTIRQARAMGPRGGIRIIGALRNLNQPIFRPPGPNGWPEEAEAWITPQGLAARLGFASGVGQLLAKTSNIDPRAFAETALRDALSPSTAFAVGAAPERWEGLTYAIASPEFNRR